jgi:hypothetical protein
MLQGVQGYAHLPESGHPLRFPDNHPLVSWQLFAELLELLPADLGVNLQFYFRHQRVHETVSPFIAASTLPPNSSQFER